VPTPPFIVWKDAYSVGNDELNTHHKGIISIVNDLYSAIQNQSAKAELGSILDRLLDYTQSHFQREESLMAEHQFPGLPQHKVVHERMVLKTEELCGLGLRHNDDAVPETMAFLKDWWVQHIRVMDAQYRPYMAK